MINLISPKEKEKFFMEKISRMVIVLWFLLFFFIVCLILVLWAVNIYAKSQLGVQEAFSSSAKEPQKMDRINQAKGKIETVNLGFGKVDSFYANKIYFSPLIEKISETLPDGVYLNSFSIIITDKIEVSLAGFAPQRDDLLKFKSNLESDKNFVNISFPASNWVEKTNIDFSVSFEINP
jgi:Tfp pilus assembly protein PilN